MSKFKYLFIILVLAFVLRVFLLDSYPVSLSVDEISIGYDAYSLLKTGHDIHKNSIPFVFKSLGDYKSPLYIYFTVPSVAIFGLTEFATRFPSAIFGTLTVFLAYLVSIKLSRSHTQALFTSLTMACLPWHLFLSRGAYEANLAFLFSLFTFYYFIQKRLNPALLFTLFSILTYHSPKIFLLLLLPGLFYFIRPKIKIISLVLVLVLVSTLFIPNFLSRGIVSSLFRDPEINISITHFTGNPIFAHGFLLFQSAITHYFQYFDPGFLFSHGLNLTYQPSFDSGVMYWVQAPFLLAGLYIFLKKPNKGLLMWALLSPLPAALTQNPYHIIRALPLVFPLCYLTALGITKFPIFKKIYLPLLLISVLILSDLYFVHFPVQKSDQSFDPMKAISLYALSKVPKYSRIIIDPVFGKSAPNLVGVPELYLLFYGHINPQTYWSSKHSEGFGNIYFRHITWFENDEFAKNTLLIGSPWSLPPDKIPSDLISHTFYFQNHTPAYFAIPR